VAGLLEAELDALVGVGDRVEELDDVPRVGVGPSSSALASRERATVPGWTCIRSASRRSFSASSSSSVMLIPAIGAI
jgi:hypothetical protein